MRYLTVDDIEALAIGAAILGTGGGGNPYIGKLRCQQELRRTFPADCIAGDQSRGKLVDDGTDHRVQVGDFVMQFDVAPAH